MENPASTSDSTKAPLCRCKDHEGIPCFAVHRVSKTDKNKDREFYACAVSKDKGGCGFFAWQEELYLDEVSGLLKKKYVPLPEGYVKKPTVEVRVQKCEDTIATLQQQLQDLQQKINLLNEHQPRKVQKTEARGAPNGVRKQ